MSQDMRQERELGGIEATIHGISKSMEEVKTSVKEILVQTTEHNHRMTKMEVKTEDYDTYKKKVDDTAYWKKYIIIAAGLLWTALIIATPLMLRFVKTEIKNTVTDSLAQYDIIVE